MRILTKKTSSIRELIPNYKVIYANIVTTLKKAVFEHKTQMTVHLNLLQKQQGNLFSYEKGSASFINKNIVEIKRSYEFLNQKKSLIGKAI